MDFSFSNRLLALLRQPRKQKAAKPLPRPVRLSLEALEDRLVPSATLAAVKLPPPVALPPDSFLIDIDSTPVTAGAAVPNLCHGSRSQRCAGQQRRERRPDLRRLRREPLVR